ncbi:MAG: ATP-binding protein [Mariprofundaceae bacterium]
MADSEITKLRMQVPATLQAVRTICAVVNAVASNLCEDGNFPHQVELGVAEAVGNIVKHGYKQNPDCVITVGIQTTSEYLQVSLRDQAPHFNPLSGEVSDDYEESFEKVSEDSMGAGRVWMRQFMDHLEYKRLHDGNLLIMQKYYATEAIK